jgi:4-diphosphocytidyl-2-C-methyl-D-erythritol kinase
MIQFPNCKINLGLNILGKRPDGFHNLESIFYPVPLRDALEIVIAPEGVFQFQSSGLTIPGLTEHNLCVRAFHLLQSDFGLPGVKMHLHKVIPMGSGLGGGSSNGTFTLKMLNDLFGLGLDNEKLKNYATRLGSDCAFFIENHPLFAFEKGEQFEPVMVDLTGLFLAIIIPGVHVDTADAYRMVVPGKPERSLKHLAQLPLKEWKGLIVNDFEKPVFERYPVIREIKQRLYDSGALYASMSGSGSAVYGLFEETPQIKEFFPGCVTWISQPL